MSHFAGKYEEKEGSGNVTKPYLRVSLYIHITDTATNDIGEIVKDTLGKHII
jgi:hypothetical protein